MSNIISTYLERGFDLDAVGKVRAWVLLVLSVDRRSLATLGGSSSISLPSHKKFDEDSF